MPRELTAMPASTPGFTENMQPPGFLAETLMWDRVHTLRNRVKSLASFQLGGYEIGDAEGGHVEIRDGVRGTK